MTTDDASALSRDQALWKQWQSGDPAAGCRLLELYDAAIFRLIRRFHIQDSDVEDVYSELVVALTQYKERCALKSSFFGLARRMVLSSMVARERVRSRLQLVERLEDNATVNDTKSVHPSELREAIHRCLLLLKKPFERELFRKRFLEGWDNQSLASKYEKSSNHIAVVVHNALIQMRQCLQKAGFSSD